MIGIYKITNKINKKIYIGQSKDIEYRWKDHKRRFKNQKTPIQKAIYKYGIDNFSFEVLKECSIDCLNDLEIYYIQLYNSTDKNIGYNITSGGDKGPIKRGINSPVAILTKEIVEFIRNLYIEGVNKKDAYREVRKKYNINKNTFTDVWLGKTYKDINYYVYDSKYKELINKKRRLNKSKNTVTNSKKYIQDIRNQKASGMQKSVCYQQYKSIMSIHTFNDIWFNRTYSYILPTVENHYIKNKHNKSADFPVDQYDLNGNFIKTYNTISEAVIEIKGYWNKNFASTIRFVCKQKQKTAYGYIWKFSNCND